MSDQNLTDLGAMLESKLENELPVTSLMDCDFLETVELIKKLYFRMGLEFEHDPENLQKLVFDKYHDLLISRLKTELSREDVEFYEKCKLLNDLNVNAQHFGAIENHSISLIAATVELAVLDGYRSPLEKMNCLCGTYDLIFAELKTAIISYIISKKNDSGVDLPVVDNADIIPILMVVIIKSKLPYLYTNFSYIQYFCDTLGGNNNIQHVFNSFAEAIERIGDTDLSKIPVGKPKIPKSLKMREAFELAASKEAAERNKAESITDDQNKSLLDEEKERSLQLISRWTDESE